MARQHLYDLRNIYAVLTDILHKNIVKASMPFPSILASTNDALRHSFGYQKATTARACISRRRAVVSQGFV